MEIITTSDIEVTGDLKIGQPEIVIKNVVEGKWNIYHGGIMLLHENLGLQTATSLSIWEDLNDHVKVTRNESDKIVGVYLKLNDEIN